MANVEKGRYRFSLRTCPIFLSRAAGMSAGLFFLEFTLIKCILLAARSAGELWKTLAASFSPLFFNAVSEARGASSFQPRNKLA